MIGSTDETSISGSTRPALVGREREIALLREALSAVLPGRGRVALISGEAGIGKTALVEHLAEEAATLGALVLVGRCYDRTETPPYGPFLELFGGYDPEPGMPSLPSAFSRWWVGETITPDALAQQVQGFFAALAAVRPVLLLLEDLNWADYASLDLLRSLARAVSALPILMLVTYRTDELTRQHPLYALLPLLEREATPARLRLGPLAIDALRTLVAGRYGLADSESTRLASYLETRAEGNALFVTQLLRALEEAAILVEGAHGWELGDPDRLVLPSPLLEVIDARVARQEEATQALLAVAAVIGQEVPLALWATVTKVEEDTILAAIEQAVAAHLLHASADGTTVRFVHALVREALYVGVLPPRRRRWHRLIGEALATVPAVDPDAVAYHFQQAGDARATEWLIRAGERAVRAYSWATAAERFEAALARLTEQEAPPVERAVLLNHIAMLLRYVDAPRALVLTDEAYALAMEASEPGLASMCQFRAGWMRCLAGDMRTGLDAMEQGLAVFDALGAAEQARCRSLLQSGAKADELAGADVLEGMLVNWMASAGRLEKARSIGWRVVTEIPVPELRAGEGTNGYVDVLLGLAEAEALLGRPDIARTLHQQAGSGYEMIADYQHLALTWESELTFVQLPYFPDNLEQRRWLAREAEKCGRRAEGAIPFRPAHFRVVPLLVLEGFWADARETAARLYDGASWAGRALAAPWLAMIARDQGDAALARRIVAETFPSGPSTEPGNHAIWTALPLQRLAADLSRDDGDLTAARAWLQAHDRWLAYSGAVLGLSEGALSWAQYYREIGDATRGRQFAEQGLVRASDPRQPLALIAVHRFLGQLDMQEKRFAGAHQHLQQSLQLTDACDAPFERALTLLELAKLQAAQGQIDQARALLTEARSICETLCAEPTLKRVRAVENRLGSPQKVAYPAGLSAREVEVLQLVAAGNTNREIAAELFLSERTVQTHLRSILTKTDTTNRTAAARFARDYGLA